jgi:hypothetical protein
MAITELVPVSDNSLPFSEVLSNDGRHLGGRKSGYIVFIKPGKVFARLYWINKTNKPHTGEWVTVTLHSTKEAAFPQTEFLFPAMDNLGKLLQHAREYGYRVFLCPTLADYTQALREYLQEVPTLSDYTTAVQEHLRETVNKVLNG